ncbi:hypothetical protein PXH59_00350 (plasmid) [Xenorhabdus sp. SF857]|uniref:hypothetical protein n=1 Tax=Xenorhabdus bakwenae TaxID=3026967 RepID=UPI002557D57C|nr:hypothetical protein [Xenorhabdus sp. SF857]WFQ78133.1 hypothetical protein PXH59_00350 [Xenorhabdus sp. SF857]
MIFNQNEESIVMGEIHTYLPRLIMNELLISELITATPPCFALGYVEEKGIKKGCIALRPETSIPDMTTERGFRFGHSVIGAGASAAPVLHFAFEFYDHAIYHGLVPTGNPIIQAVLTTMCESGDYFFFAINPNQAVTAFRAQLQDEDLSGLRRNQQRFGDTHCTPEEYNATVKAFTQNPDPPGQVMQWICRNNWAYLDLEKHALELTPKR